MTTLTPEGLDALLDGFQDAVDGFEDLEAVNLQAADEVLGYVQPPVLTGRLASTVRAEADALGYRVVAGGPEAPYGPIVNARTGFMDTAAERSEQAVVEHYTDHTQQLLDQIQGA